MPRDDLNHYWITYSSEEWVEHTIIETNSEPYQDAEDWASRTEASGQEENIAVWEFEPITGVFAAILNIVNG